MKLTRGTDYGIQGLLYLAQKPPRVVSIISDISAAQDVPESYLAKVFQELCRAGLVISYRGAKGGFTLARDPSEITVRQVIEAIEGPIALNRCLDPREGCDRIDNCALYPVLREAQERLIEVLESKTLKDLSEQNTPSVQALEMFA